jgi:BlaI family transcriptional regulator, penicillinase repressor
MRSRNSLPLLAEAQLEIMNILWRSGGGTVAQVLEQVRLRRPVSRNTVQTMLSRLDEKGWLKHRDEDGTFYYLPVIPREKAQHQVLGQVIDTVFDGSTAGIVMALLQNRSLTREEAARIRRMIKDAEERR